MYLSYIKRSKTIDQIKKENKNTKRNEKQASSSLGGISIGIVLVWLGGSIVFNVDIL